MSGYIEMSGYNNTTFDDFVEILMKNLISKDRTYNTQNWTLNLLCTTLLLILQLIFF